MKFGFQIRNNRNRPTHQGMLDLLRGARKAGAMESACANGGPFGIFAGVVGRVAAGLIALCACSQARAQQTNQLDCQGVMGHTPAVLSGVRQYAPYNALGDGYVRFNGSVTAGGIQGRITYEGYTQTAPFSGAIETAQGNLSVGILDNTGGQMIIYGGKPSLGPPDIIGRFSCSWR